MTHPSPEASPVIPHLTVGDSDAAIEFYRQAFGAEEVSKITDPNSKKVMHASVSINGGLVMLNDDFPEYNDGRSLTPAGFGGSPVTIHLNLADVDTVWQRAVDAGASVVMPLEDQFWGDRYGVLTDPFGHRWSLATHQRDVTPEEARAAMNQGGCSAQ
jgi:PhnB protein